MWYAPAVALCLLAVAFAATQSHDANAAVSHVAVATPRAAATATPTPIAPQPTVVPAVPAADLEGYAGLPVGLTTEGQPFLGNPDAPITINEYSDYLCPFCARHFRETYPLLLDEYVATGQARLVFHEFPIPSLHPTAPAGHQAALCVAEQDAARFWAMHDELYARQAEWSRLPDPAAFLAALAEELGADPDLYAECMDAGRTLAAVEAGIDAGVALGFNGTPSFRIVRTEDEYTFDLVGAYPMARFREVIDAMLAGEEAPAEPTPEPPQLPYWAGEGLAPDPDRPGFTLAGDPYKGSEDAPLTVVEFSDFQCPACARHVLNVQATLDEQFVETGKVRWVFKNLPLRMHPYAPAAAAAAECAGDEGVFWPFHDRLFETQEQWAVEGVDVEIMAIAAEFEVDMELFESCFMGRSGLERVLPDLYDAQGVASATPTFIILQGQTGTVLSGSRNAQDFATLLESFLALDASEDSTND